LNDRAERDIDIPVTPEMGEGDRTIARVLDIVTARIRASLWLIVIAGVIAVALVLFGVPVWHAVAGLLAIVALIALVPRKSGSDILQPALDRQSAATQRSSAMELMAEALPDPTILLNATGQVLFCNAPAKRLFETLREGSHISSVIRTPEFLDAVSAAPRQGSAVTVTYAERVPVGRRMAVTVAPLASQSETGGNILILMRDLTELERINQMRADFIANASHELRTPLASLRGFIETLQGTAKEDPKARDRFLAIMGEQASRMTRLIDALLSLSRVEMNAHVPPSGLIDLNEVLEHARDTLEPLAKSNELRIEVEGFGRPAIVRGDRDELVQVLQNLVHNALKYGANGSKVRLEAKRLAPHGRQGTRYAIAVIDQGPGIAPEHLPRLTERFYRIEAESKDKGGTGLGLAIVKHILNRHRGELLIASKPGKGSTFTIVLNAASEGRSERAAAAE
jgi:two-component system phosphate regulon sensor histidine kinase PhoR